MACAKQARSFRQLAVHCLHDPTGDGTCVLGMEMASCKTLYDKLLSDAHQEQEEHVRITRTALPTPAEGC